MLNPIRAPIRLWPVFLVLALGASACGKADAPEGGQAATAPASGSASAPAPATRDWTQTVVATEAGGFRMGNPDAPVKLLEFASFTCSQSQRFHLEGADALKSGLVRSALSNSSPGPTSSPATTTAGLPPAPSFRTPI